MEEKSEYVIKRKCPSCFAMWIDCMTVTAQEYIVYQERDNPLEKICGYCVENHPMTSRKLLERQFDILEHVQVSDFPDIMRHLFQHLDLRDEPNGR